MSQMIVQVVGAQRGSFKNDDEKAVDYASIFVLESLKPDADRGLEAVGMKADKYSATPEAFATIKANKLPAHFLCEMQTSTSATGTKIKLLTANPFKGFAQ